MTAKLTTLIVLALVAMTIVTGCAAPTPAAPTQAPAPPPTAVPPTAAPAAPAPTAVPPTAAPTQAPAATEPPPTAAPPAAPAAAAPECIEIGSSIPLTGRFGSLGTQVKPGYAYAVEDINAGGGIYVKEFDKKIPLCLTVYDDESDWRPSSVTRT